MPVKHIFGAAGFAAVLCFGLTHQAVAEAPAAYPGTMTSHVSTGGLDLTQMTGRTHLLHRVAVAAGKLCANVTGASSLTDPGFEACFRQATADGRRQADAQVAAARRNAMVAESGQ